MDYVIIDSTYTNVADLELYWKPMEDTIDTIYPM